MNLTDRLLYDVVRPFAPQWFADRYRAQHANRLASVTARQVVSAVGVHCIGPRRNGFGPFLAGIDAAGRMLAGCKTRDDHGASHEVKLLWPEIVTVGAYTEFDGMAFDYTKFKARAVLNPWIDYWEAGNEESSNWAAQTDKYIALMPQFSADGFGLEMFACASGNPPYEWEPGGAEAYAQITRACKYAKDHGYKVRLALHEYVSDGGTIGRFQNLVDYIEDRDALIPVDITEYLFETHPGDRVFMEAIKANDPKYMGDRRITFCAVYTLGGYWSGSNYQNAVPQLGEYIAEVEPMSVEYWVVDHIELNGEPGGLNFVMWSDIVENVYCRKERTPPIPPTDSINLDPDIDASAQVKVQYHTLTVNVYPAEAAPLAHVAPGAGTYQHGAVIEQSVTFDPIP